MTHLKNFSIFSCFLLCTIIIAVHAGSRFPNVKGAFNTGKGAIGAGLSKGKTVIGGGLSAGKNVIGTGISAGKNVIGTSIYAGKNAIGTGLSTGKDVIETGISSGTKTIGSTLYSAKNCITPLKLRLNSFYKNFQLSDIQKKQIGVDESINIHVNESNVFEKTCNIIKSIPDKHLKYKPIIVKIGTETGPRVFKKWLTLLSMEIVSKHNLFKNTSEKYDGIEINPVKPPPTPIRLEQYECVGRICALAIIHRQILAVPFTTPFLKTILRQKITLEDLKEARSDIYEKLYGTSMKNHQLTFSVDGVPLKRTGTHLIVQTQADKTEFIRLAIEYWYDKSTKLEMEAFMYGFDNLIPNNWIESFSAYELGLMLSGTPITKINVNQLKGAILPPKTKDNAKITELFLMVLDSLNNEELAKLLTFITGTPRVPLGDFKKLSLKIHELGSSFEPLLISVPFSSMGHTLQFSHGFQTEKQILDRLKQKLQNVQVPRIVQFS